MEDDSWQDEDGNWHGSSYWVSIGYGSRTGMRTGKRESATITNYWRWKYQNPILMW